MSVRVVAILFSLLVSLPGEARISLPDSLLSIPRAYAYNQTSLDTSLAILNTMRERKMAPEWRLNLAEGDMYINKREVQQSIPLYKQALTDKAVSDSARLAIYQRMMDAYDITYLELQQQTHRRQLIVNWLIALLVLILLVTVIILYYNRELHRRNVAFMMMFNRLEAYRQTSITDANLSSETAEGTGDDTREAEDPSEADSQVPQTPDAGAMTMEMDEDERLFVEMDRQVTRDRLFLQPDLDREKLMLLIGVDKNRFGHMMSKYATNTSVYINSKRVSYGAQLLVGHPEYTIAFIAESCGMRNTVTFNRTFKEVYGMTPSEYRANMDRLNREGGVGTKAGLKRKL